VIDNDGVIDLDTLDVPDNEPKGDGAIDIVLLDVPNSVPELDKLAVKD
jgi:hypothetical protein